jgi:hypothetical protein
MPRKLIKDFGGLRLEVEVRKWDASYYRADYTIDGWHGVSLYCFRTKADPEETIIIQAAQLSASLLPYAAAFGCLVIHAVMDGEEIEANGGLWHHELSALPCGATVQ